MAEGSNLNLLLSVKTTLEGSHEVRELILARDF